MMLFPLLICAGLLAVCGSARAEERPQAALAPLLDNHFSDPDAGFVLLDSGSGEILAERSLRLGHAIPLGSLVKPFVALAYGTKHAFRYPAFSCGENECWYVPGHGPFGLSSAIAHSCNAYFQRLSAGVNHEDLAVLTRRFGLPAPPALAARRAFFGIGDQWLVTPLAMARAYGRLARESSGPGVAEILGGLALSAREGTAQGVGRALHGAEALAKTGTAPCVHPRRSGGDGYGLVLYPADQPRYTLLVQVHGKTGRQAADLAGEMLRTVIEGE